MSSKNYLKPKHVHRERSQPSYRKKLGFLEKKKDYKKRAKNFNFKKDHLALLQRKAETKNPDEFYFAMINSSIASGSHNEHKKCLRPDEVRQMVSQDVHYLQYHQQLERKVFIIYLHNCLFVCFLFIFAVQILLIILLNF